MWNWLPILHGNTWYYIDHVFFLVSTLAPFCSHLGIGGTGCSSSNIVEYLGLDPSPWEAVDFHLAIWSNATSMGEATWVCQILGQSQPKPATGRSLKICGSEVIGWFSWQILEGNRTSTGVDQSCCAYVDPSDLMVREEGFLYKNVPFNPKTMGDWCVERSNPNL